MILFTKTVDLLSLQLMLCEDTHGNKFIIKAINNSERHWNSEEVSRDFVEKCELPCYINLLEGSIIACQSSQSTSLCSRQFFGVFFV